MTRILGIDTGSQVCGFGFIEAEGTTFRYIECGVFRLKAGRELPDRLAELWRDLCGVLAETKPDLCAVERPFVNPKFGGNGAITIGAAFGVAISCARLMSPVIEVGPTEVKRHMGHGASKKEQVGFVGQRLLNLDAVPQPLDAADALAIALTGHALTTKGPQLHETNVTSQGSRTGRRSGSTSDDAIQPRAWSRTKRRGPKGRGLFGG